VPTPSLPDIYTFAEDELPDSNLIIKAHRLPVIEPTLIKPEDSQAAFGKVTWKRLGEGGSWSFRLGLRWELPGRVPGLPWIPTVTRREAKYEPPRSPEYPTPEKIKRGGRIVQLAFARAVCEIRNEKYLDVEQLAADAEIPVWQLTAVEEARLDGLPFALVYKLAQAFDMKMSQLARRMEEHQGGEV
jgi:hypothetical protein